MAAGEGAPPPASNTPQTVVSGTVQAPGGQVAFFKKNNLGDLFVSKAHAALTGLVNVPDSTIVQLARLNANATNFSVLTTTTTSGGRYSFNLTALGLEPASDLMVRVAGPGGKEMRSFVVGTVTDINPASEAAYQLAVQSLNGGPMSNLTLQEASDISGAVGLIGALQNLGTATSIDQAVDLVKTTVGTNAQLTGFLAAAATNGQTPQGTGGIFLGGIARLNEVESFKSLYPISVNDQVSYHLATQVYEGLVKYNQNDMTLLPCIAYKWELSADNLEYTFHLRSGVKFQDDPCFPEGKGRDIKASDFKYCFDQLCSADPANSQFDVTFKDKVEGANASFKASKRSKQGNVSRVKVVNDSTLTIKLTHPIPGFLNILAMPGSFLYAPEAHAKYGAEMRTKTVGTGPFSIET